jgi:hypothetical protein
MWHKVSDLSPDQRHTIEGLLGRQLAEDEGLSIVPSRILKDAPAGDERKEAFDQYLSHLDKLARRAEGIENDLDTAIDEACDRVRHHR